MIRTRTLAASLFALALVAGGAMAQDTMPAAASSSGDMNHMGQMDHMEHMKGMKGAKGMHHMPATVTSADPATGLVEATAGGMSLKLHFPPAAMKDLKAGDSITLHMGFTKP